jgi:tetratricopeptide (TPR) repeat protein
METKEELLKGLEEIYLKLSLIFEKSKKNFCGSCRNCCTYVLTHGVCDIEYEYIKSHIGNIREAENFRDYINKKRHPDGTIMYKACPFYDYSSGGCSIYLVRPYSCRTYGLYGQIPPPPFCTFSQYTIIYPADEFYNILPMAKDFFNLKSLYEIITAPAEKEKAEKCYKFSLHLFYRDNMERAEEFLKQTILYNPAHGQAYYQLAILYYNRGNINRAITFTEESLKYETNNSDIKIKLALFLTRACEYSRAKELFSQVVEKDPLNKMGLLGLGNIFFITGDYEAAKEYCYKALQLDPHMKMAELILNQIESL